MFGAMEGTDRRIAVVTALGMFGLMLLATAPAAASYGLIAAGFYDPYWAAGIGVFFETGSLLLTLAGAVGAPYAVMAYGVSL